MYLVRDLFLILPGYSWCLHERLSSYFTTIEILFQLCILGASILAQTPHTNADIKQDQFLCQETYFYKAGTDWRKLDNYFQLTYLMMWNEAQSMLSTSFRWHMDCKVVNGWPQCLFPWTPLWFTPLPFSLSAIQ